MADSSERVYQPGDKAGKPSGPSSPGSKTDYSDKPKRMDFSIADQAGYEKAVREWEERQKRKRDAESIANQAEAVKQSK